MDGVTVLYTREVLVSGGYGIFICAVFMTILFMASFSCVMMSIIGKLGIGCIIISIFLSLFSGFFAYGLWLTVSPVYETYQDVIIDDTVSFNEFSSKYKIIEQNGQIITVAEKEDE